MQSQIQVSTQRPNATLEVSCDSPCPFKHLIVPQNKPRRPLRILYNSLFIEHLRFMQYGSHQGNKCINLQKIRVPELNSAANLLGTDTTA